MTFLDQWIERGRPDETTTLKEVYRANHGRIPREALCDCARDFGVYGALHHPHCASLRTSQPCNGCDTVDYAGELDEAGRCAECAAS